MHIEIIGLLAAICTTISFLPQVLRTWKTRSVADISLSMYLVLCTGLVLWLVYGLYIGSLPVVAANAVTLVLAGAVLVMRIRYSKK
ncbi:MAG: SemiSWEET transporter [Proteobacteria bacterium]|nr:SemiSWEET transporter [Pseudomonadota bacterium]MBU1610228.1 SemiSWEET transporter [Pseudomonadota bacterium]